MAFYLFFVPLLLLFLMSISRENQLLMLWQFWWQVKERKRNTNIKKDDLGNGIKYKKRKKVYYKDCGHECGVVQIGNGFFFFLLFLKSY